MSDIQFTEDFRLTKSQFDMLHEKLMYSEAFTCRSSGKAPVDSRKCLLIGLWVLATPDCYRSIASRFNVSKSTVKTCLNKVINGLVSDVCKNAIKMPRTENERVSIANRFEEIAGMRDVLGAIDGCHIDMQAPIGKKKSQFFDRSKNYSIVLQAVCDADLFFIDIDIRWPGSVHDARVLRTSDLHANVETLFPNNYYLVGDPAYPLKSWLMRPYKKLHRLTRPQKRYNKVLSKTRQVIERSFGVMKQKFRRLYFLHMMDIRDTVNAVVACCVLHNISMASDEYAEYLIFGEQNCRTIQDDQQNQAQPVNAKEKRQLICDEAWQRFLQRRRQHLLLLPQMR